MPGFKMLTMTLACFGLLVPPLLMVRADNDASQAVGKGTVVIFEFTITVPEANVMFPKNVSQFVPGHHDLLPNLEKALDGMKRGEEKRVDLSSEDAFGPYDESKKAVIDLEELPPDTKPGTVLTTEEGVPFVVTELSGSTASVDFNHPLAGKHLVIDVKILEIAMAFGEGDGDEAESVDAGERAMAI